MSPLYITCCFLANCWYCNCASTSCCVEEERRRGGREGGRERGLIHQKCRVLGLHKLWYSHTQFLVRALTCRFSCSCSCFSFWSISRLLAASTADIWGESITADSSTNGYIIQTQTSPTPTHTHTYTHTHPHTYTSTPQQPHTHTHRFLSCRVGGTRLSPHNHILFPVSRINNIFIPTFLYESYH